MKKINAEKNQTYTRVHTHTHPQRRRWQAILCFTPFRLVSGYRCSLLLHYSSFLVVVLAFSPSVLCAFGWFLAFTECDEIARLALTLFNNKFIFTMYKQSVAREHFCALCVCTQNCIILYSIKRRPIASTFWFNNSIICIYIDSFLHFPSCSNLIVCDGVTLYSFYLYSLYTFWPMDKNVVFFSFSLHSKLEKMIFYFLLLSVSWTPTSDFALCVLYGVVLRIFVWLFRSKKKIIIMVLAYTGSHLVGTWSHLCWLLRK